MNDRKQRLQELLNQITLKTSNEIYSSLEEEGFMTDGSLKGCVINDLYLDGHQDLHDFNFSFATLRNVMFWECYGENLDFTSTVFEHCTFKDSQLTGNFTDAKFYHSTLIGDLIFGEDVLKDNFNRVHIIDSTLKLTHLSGDWQNAFIKNTYLENLELWGDWKNAKIRNSELKNVVLISPQAGGFHGVDFSGSSLVGCQLKEADFDESTILPDGTPWSPATNWEKFTDPTHPQFWTPARTKDEE